MAQPQTSAMQPTERSDDKPKKRKRVPRAVREPQMLDAATEVFSERGFHAASMDDIAARVEVTKPMLYAYFGSKEGLYRATIERAGDHIIKVVEALMSEPDARKRLCTGTDALLDFVFSQRAAWSVIYNEGMGPDGLVDITGIRDKVSSFIARTFAEVKRGQVGNNGASEPSEAEVETAWPFAIGTIGSCEAVLRWWTGRERFDQEACRRICQDLVQSHLDGFLGTAGAA